jgi:hypothetical protein
MCWGGYPHPDVQYARALELPPLISPSYRLCIAWCTPYKWFCYGSSCVCSEFVIHYLKPAPLHLATPPNHKSQKPISRRPCVWSKAVAARRAPKQVALLLNLGGTRSGYSCRQRFSARWLGIRNCMTRNRMEPTCFSPRCCSGQRAGWYRRASDSDPTHAAQQR